MVTKIRQDSFSEFPSDSAQRYFYARTKGISARFLWGVGRTNKILGSTQSSWCRFMFNCLLSVEICVLQFDDVAALLFELRAWFFWFWNKWSCGCIWIWNFGWRINHWSCYRPYEAKKVSSFGSCDFNWCRATPRSLSKCYLYLRGWIFYWRFQPLGIFRCVFWYRKIGSG